MHDIIIGWPGLFEVGFVRVLLDVANLAGVLSVAVNSLGTIYIILLMLQSSCFKMNGEAAA